MGLGLARGLLALAPVKELSGPESWQIPRAPAAAVRYAAFSQTAAGPLPTTLFARTDQSALPRRFPALQIPRRPQRIAPPESSFPSQTDRPTGNGSPILLDLLCATSERPPVWSVIQGY